MIFLIIGVKKPRDNPDTRLRNPQVNRIRNFLAAVVLLLSIFPVIKPQTTKVALGTMLNVTQPSGETPPHNFWSSQAPKFCPMTKGCLSPAGDKRRYSSSVNRMNPVDRTSCQRAGHFMTR